MEILSRAQELLDCYGSPLYVYEGDRFRQTIQQITGAIPYARTQFHFASVTNGNLSLLKIVQEMGWGLHANSPGDVHLGLQAGFLPQQIVYSGSNLNRAEMAQLLQWGVRTLNLDSLSQLQLCGEVQQEIPQPTALGLRLNFSELTGDSRIGVHPDEFPAAIALTQKYGLSLNGIHFYRGTGTNATQAFTAAIDQLLAIAQQLPDWRYLDFGGGFGYPYQGGAAFNWQEFGAVLTRRMLRLARPIDLMIEPGRAAIAGCATLLAKVVSVKWQGKKQIVGVDTTVANLSVPAVHGGYRKVQSVRHGDLFLTDVCGNTTYSRDYLGRNCQLPALQIDDAIAILDVGAYGYAMSSHFLHRPRPAEVLLDNFSENGKDLEHRMIRQREDYSILWSNQVFQQGSSSR
jgi:diaminopimelate decarboxylase